MSFVKYGLLIILVGLIVAHVIRTKPSQKERSVAIAATEEILELYNKEALDQITARLVAYPGFASSDKLDSKRAFTGRIIHLLRRSAGSCQIASAEYQVIRQTHDLRVDVVATCERMKVKLALFWWASNDQLAFVDFWIQEDTMKAIPEIPRYVFETLRQSRRE